MTNAGYVPPLALGDRPPRPPSWLDGFLRRSPRDRGLLFAWRGYSGVRHGPIRATGWYVLVERATERHPYGPFPSRIAAQQWHKRWIDSPGGRLRFRDWQLAGSWSYDDPVPRQQYLFRRSGPMFGFERPPTRTPRHKSFPCSREGWDVQRSPFWAQRAREGRRLRKTKPIRVFWSPAAISRTGHDWQATRDEVFEDLRCHRILERHSFYLIFDHPNTDAPLVRADAHESWDCWEAIVQPCDEDGEPIKTSGSIVLVDAVERFANAIEPDSTALVRALKCALEWDLVRTAQGRESAG